MKNYELLAILKPSLDTEELDKIVEKITEEIKSYKGSVASVDKIGRKKLAYDVQGYRDGFFANIVLSIPAETVVEFKRNLKLNENILRYMFMEESKKAQVV
ncbi:MAG: 30S ribosomal protein S6 [bacterium]|nr:30S ribosomal protein S6 [bacterium]